MGHLIKMVFFFLILNSCETGDKLGECLSSKGILVEKILIFEDYLVKVELLDGKNKQAYVDLVTKISVNQLLVNSCDLYNETKVTPSLFIEGGFDVHRLEQMKNCISGFYDDKIVTEFFSKFVSNALDASALMDIYGEIYQKKYMGILSVDNLPEIIFNDNEFRAILLFFLSDKIVFRDLSIPCPGSGIRGSVSDMLID